MKLPDATIQNVLRNQNATLQSLDTSLMPEGFQAAITKQEMAELIGFLKDALEQ